jgi:hypothetical protein
MDILSEELIKWGMDDGTKEYLGKRVPTSLGMEE